VPKVNDILVSNVNRLISLKKNNPKLDTSLLESEVDSLVYSLYGLTEEEIQVIEGGKIEL